jgi:hypothetical protein
MIHVTAITNVSCQSGCGIQSSWLAHLVIVTSVAVEHPELFPHLQGQLFPICHLSQA